VKSPFPLKKINPDTRALLKQIFLGVGIIITVGCVLTLIWHGTRAESVTLTTVEVIGGETINHTAVRVLALAELEGQYAGFIPKRFAWLYPKSAIALAVAEVPRIHSIEVERLDGQTVVVSFLEYWPDALWCVTLAAENCVFLDETGYAYAQSPTLDGGSLLRFIHTSQTPELGQSLVIKSDFLLLNRLTDLLAEQGWFVSHVEVDQARDAFLHVVGGGEFKVTLTQSPDETVENLFVVLTSKEFVDLAPGTFQYIDLRFGNKVFINEEEPVLEEAATSTQDVILETEAATTSDEAEVE